ncbi:hypothetical protein G6045_37445 [Streptomyces sp. YC504]|uniref:Uncharacterized protein n=1 Tax=Streptomyces mesophilus TaxID=1775132 RepID=A0A6G4XV36_9ACTN|nr:hypothetical protein [Streptomyces mesophilus]NGO81308.1 hypothetical protein [Streptomyces mesophilus]
MELTVAIISFAAALAPGIKDWLDSVAIRNRAAARAEIIRARRTRPTQERRAGDGAELPKEGGVDGRA